MGETPSHKRVVHPVCLPHYLLTVSLGGGGISHHEDATFGKPWTITCSKSIIEALDHGGKYVQS